MIEELIVHLGDTKTGSTSIQKVLAQKAYEIPGKSLCYPSKNNHIALAKTLTQKPRFKERETRFERVSEAFRKSGAEYGVISAEHFQSVDPRVLNDAIEAYWPQLRDRLRLVAYVRPHAGKFLSAFSERVKLGADLDSLEAFFGIYSKSGGLDYTPRFEQWRVVFGSRFELRPFIRDRLYQGDVVQDFFRHVVGAEDFRITSEVAANSSLTVSQLALLREMHRQLTVSTDVRKKQVVREAKNSLGRIVSEYMQSVGLGADRSKLRMPAELSDRFKDRYAADAEALDKAFFDDFPMSDALEKSGRDVADAPQSLQAEDHFDPATISSVQVFSQVLADLVGAKPNQVKRAIGNIRTSDETALKSRRGGSRAF